MCAQPTKDVMKNPLWILNSALATLLVGVILFILLARPEKPARLSLAHISPAAPAKTEVPHIDPSLIYKNDLFGTYQEVTPIVPSEPKRSPATPPPPPQPQTVSVSQPAQPQFLPPLGVSLKGIIYSHNDSDNRAIIADNKSKKETLYKIGDKILDAEIIHIDHNKVMLIRSNGQQETLFVTSDDAQADPIYKLKDSWDTVAKKISDTEYTIYHEPFVQRVHNLAQFIDMLDITTAFHKGKIVGCRVGKFQSTSIAPLLGLQQGDIIMTINNIPTTTTKHRVAIYNSLKDVDRDMTIPVTLSRAGNEMTIHYTIKAVSPEERLEKENETITVPIPQQVRREEIATIDQAPQHMNNIQQVQQRDKHAMLEYGGRRSLLQHAQS